MPRSVAEGEGGTASGNGVYDFIHDLILEGKDAKFVSKSGRYLLNWSRALDCYADYRARKNPQFKSKKLSRRSASNGLRSALLNFYKKEGAKEYKESKKVNDKDEVVERQFQMPSRVFESLFGHVQLSDDGEFQDEQEMSSVKPESEMESRATPNSSDTGFDEEMDLACNDADVLSPDHVIPSEIFDPSAVDSSLEEICLDGISDEISEDLGLVGVVQDICPSSGSVKGGYQFYISLTEQLPDDVSSGMAAEFEQVATVAVQKLNSFTLYGTIPPSLQPGDVSVTVMTETGQRLGMTCFQYVDEMREMARQLVNDPEKRALWFAILSQEYGYFRPDSDLAQLLDPLNMQYQDMSVQTKQQQSLKILQLLVYTAAQTNAQQFIEMLFSTSAGQIVFDSYKGRMRLPEEVARANGHDDLAQYLQDINTRLSKEETECQSKAIDWVELMKAVQNQATLGPDKEIKQQRTPCDSDDNLSDYFADAETSSCGSLDLHDAYPSDSEDKDVIKKGCGIEVEEFKDGHLKKAAISHVRNENPVEDMKPPDMKEQKGSSISDLGCSVTSEFPRKCRTKKDTSSMLQGSSKEDKVSKDEPFKRQATSENEPLENLDFQQLPGSDKLSVFSWMTSLRRRLFPTQKAQECDRDNHQKLPRSNPGVKYKGSLALVMVIIVAGLTFGGPILHLAVGNGYVHVSKPLNHVGVEVNVPDFRNETVLHLAGRNGFEGLAITWVQIFVNVRARNFPRLETTLYLVAQNGHQPTVELLIQRGSDVIVRSKWQDTPLLMHEHAKKLRLLDCRDANSSNVEINLVNIKNGVAYPFRVLNKSGQPGTTWWSVTFCPVPSNVTLVFMPYYRAQNGGQMDKQAYQQLHPWSSNLAHKLVNHDSSCCQSNNSFDGCTSSSSDEELLTTCHNVTSSSQSLDQMDEQAYQQLHPWSSNPAHKPVNHDSTCCQSNNSFDGCTSSSSDEELLRTCHNATSLSIRRDQMDEQAYQQLHPWSSNPAHKLVNHDSTCCQSNNSFDGCTLSSSDEECGGMTITVLCVAGFVIVFYGLKFIFRKWNKRSLLFMNLEGDPITKGVHIKETMDVESGIVSVCSTLAQLKYTENDPIVRKKGLVTGNPMRVTPLKEQEMERLRTRTILLMQKDFPRRKVPHYLEPQKSNLE